MKEYEVMLRGVIPNVRVYTAESPKAARVLAEADGYRVKCVKPVKF